jgi:hypothetical protein
MQPSIKMETCASTIALKIGLFRLLTAVLESPKRENLAIERRTG